MKARALLGCFIGKIVQKLLRQRRVKASPISQGIVAAIDLDIYGLLQREWMLRCVYVCFSIPIANHGLCVFELSACVSIDLSVCVCVN